MDGYAFNKWVIFGAQRTFFLYVQEVAGVLTFFGQWQKKKWLHFAVEIFNSEFCIQIVYQLFLFTDVFIKLKQFFWTSMNYF